LLPFTLLMFLLSRWSGGLVQRDGAKRPLVIGPLIAGVGFALLARSRDADSYWATIFPGVLVLGFGMAVTAAPLTTVVMSAVDQRHAGIASGINNAVSRVASLLAIALFGVVLSTAFGREPDRQMSGLPPDVRQAVDVQRTKLAGAETDDSRARRAIDESFVAGYRRVMWSAAALAVASAISAATLVERRPRP